ncbi:lariat debranching enzyme [Tetranychus urticae]|uniref:Lariat debranching enzyme C-terminal domain-containing protein n=1 Tax=Tetranychus urticae TaxID=32264 RepID=T1KNM9_TETUR|nr:lariat debranching enzyme [Tetranychus urticae]
MKVAVVGCIHGELDTIYQQLADLEAHNGYKIDLLLICGDFQSIRNENDFKCISIPVKFRQLGTFHQYYKGEKTAPVLTIFIGGNHEASNYLITLPYGGWVAPNIYYMGYSNVVRYKGLRIGGISGIYNKYHRNYGHFERLPMTEDTKRSAYHTRHLEAYRFMSVQEPLDIFMSHDWPSNVVHYGNLDQLLRWKPFFAQDIQRGSLGSPMLDSLFSHLKPSRWFAAHLHVRFEAYVRHDPERETRFLALDKPLPRRKYLEILDLNPTNNSENNTEDDDGAVDNDDNLYYDKEWLAALRVTDEYLSIEEKPEKQVPELWVSPRLSLQDELVKVEEIFKGDYKIDKNFSPVEPVTLNGDSDPDRIRNFTNPQTVAFCEKLGIRDPMTLIVSLYNKPHNPAEISLSDEDDEEQEVDDCQSNGVFVIDRKRDKTLVMEQNTCNTTEKLKQDNREDIETNSVKKLKTDDVNC